MQNTFHLTVRTPESEIISEAVNSLKVMTEGGEIEIYPHHASLTGSIMFGKMQVRMPKEELDYVVQRGILFVSVEKNTVQILCFSCQLYKEIEYKSAKSYLEFIEEKLKEGVNLNDFQLKYLENEKIAMVQQVQMLEKK